jgi:ASC-1-like (ASCH) protein
MNREKNPKTLWIKRRFLEEILAGRKTLEVRVGYSNIRQLKPGMQLLLNGESPVRIKAIRKYDSFEKMISEEDSGKIVPGVEENEVLRILKTLYPPFKEKLGVFVIEIET